MFKGNTVATTLASPVGTSDTTATLTDGSSYPDGSVGPFVVTVDAGAAGEEKWLVTSRTGNGLAGITRAYDGTSATSHNAGAAVKHTISAVDLDEPNAHINLPAHDDHTQYALRAQGLALNVGNPGRAGRLYYKTDSDFLTLDDGAAFHDFQSKAVADAAYLAVAGGTLTGTLTGPTVKATNFLTSGTSTRLGASSSAIVSVDTGSVANEAIVAKLQPSQSANAVTVYNSTPTAIAYINASGNVAGTGAYTTLSDFTAKDNIEPLDPAAALAAVTSLRPVRFDYIDGEADQRGFVAQDVQEVIPEAVSAFGDDGLLGLRDGAILATLVAAVQQQQAQIEALTARVASLEAR